MIAERTQTLFGSPIPLPFTLKAESNGLFSAISTLDHDYRLRPTATRLSDAYESGEIHTMQCFKGA